MKSVDCLVVGGGMVGASAALSLAELGLSVIIVEKETPKPITTEDSIDLRVSAISLASQHVLEQLQVWDDIKGPRITPYRRLGVWESELAYTEFDARKINQSHLGHIVENRLIQQALWKKIVAHQGIEVLCPAKVESLNDQANTEQQVNSASMPILHIDGLAVQAKLLVAADGANSLIRRLAGIGCTGWQYKQSAMLIHVETELTQQDITWQQFTPTGPMAMLPLPGNMASLVWYHDKDEIKRLSTLSNEALTEQICLHFPTKLGAVKVLNKASFPLTRQHANQYLINNILLLGDAAHSINPLAGQGVNLGFKDVKALQSIIAEAIGEGEEWFSPTVLSRYEKRRRTDNALMMTAMDALYKSFSNQQPLFKLIRNAGLFAAQRVPFLKSKVLEYACGLK